MKNYQKTPEIENKNVSIQRSNKANSEVNTSGSFLQDNRQNTVYSSLTKSKENEQPLQLKKVVGKMHDLLGSEVQLHYHFTYDDAKFNYLHITFTDQRSPKNRNWQFVYKYNYNTGEWNGPYYTPKYSGAPTGAELSLAQSHLPGLKSDAIEIWRAAKAPEIAAREQAAARAKLALEDKDTAFPALSATQSPKKSKSKAGSKTKPLAPAAAASSSSLSESTLDPTVEAFVMPDRPAMAAVQNQEELMPAVQAVAPPALLAPPLDIPIGGDQINEDALVDYIPPEAARHMLGSLLDDMDRDGQEEG